MTPFDIIQTLRRAGVTLTTDGEAIRAQPASKLTPESRAALTAQKHAVIAELFHERLKHALAVQFDLERKRQTGTPQYKHNHRLFIGLLCSYETACDAAERIAA